MILGLGWLKAKGLYTNYIMLSSWVKCHSQKRIDKSTGKFPTRQRNPKRSSSRLGLNGFLVKMTDLCDGDSGLGENDVSSNYHGSVKNGCISNN